MVFDGLSEQQARVIIDIVNLQISGGYKISFDYYKDSTGNFLHIQSIDNSLWGFEKDYHVFPIDTSDIKLLTEKKYIAFHDFYEMHKFSDVVDMDLEGDDKIEISPCFYLQPLAYSEYSSLQEYRPNSYSPMPMTFLKRVGLLNELRRLDEFAEYLGNVSGYFLDDRDTGDNHFLENDEIDFISKKITWRTQTVSTIEEMDLHKYGLVDDKPINKISTVNLLALLKAAFDLVDGSNYENNLNSSRFPKKGKVTKKVFVVHGHNEVVLSRVARFVEKIGLEPIILFEQANKGKTLIEKLEYYSDVFFAVVLLTPDDVGKSLDPNDSLVPRARQNVIFELGFFIGVLGRSNVAILYDEAVELPSDYHGVVYTKIDKDGAWQLYLAKELKEAGLPIDISKIV